MATADVEVRIYYEVTEQARHFLQPSMEEACARLGLDPSSVRLIKLGRPSSVEKPIAEAIRGGLAMKDPDAVVTVVRGGLERAVAFFEFSTAVRTEDHDQQRFDAFVAAAEVGAPMIKVYAERVSGFRHGGRTDHDTRAIYKIVQQQFGTAAFELPWPVAEDGSRALTDPRFLSCPEPGEELTSLLTVLTDLALTSSSPIGPLVLEEAARLPEWASREVLANNVPFERPKIPGSRSTRVWVKDGSWNLKFNRWGHAMDPERGMAWYLRAAVGRTLIGHIHDAEISDEKDALTAFSKGTGIRVPGDAAELVTDGVIDVSKALRTSSPNRPGLSIVTNCSEFNLCDGGGQQVLKVTWERQSIPALASYGSPGRSTEITQGARFSEDEVTYTVVHDILRPAGYELVFVSFPGAQGDFAILDPEGGRTRGRTYIDVIAFHRGLRAIALVEAKGRFSRGAVLGAASRIVEWRDDPSMARLLRDRLHPIWDQATQPSTQIIVGVAYAKSELDRRSLGLGADFEISVSPERWAAESSVATALKDGGKLSLPTRFSYSS